MALLLLDDAGEVEIGNAAAEGGPDEQETDLSQAAAVCTLNLRQAPGITSSQIGRFQEECQKMMKNMSINHVCKVRQFFLQEGIDTPASRQLLQDLAAAPDPFHKIKTLEQQLAYFAEHFGMVKPVAKFLDYRTDYWLNPESAQYEMIQVPLSFQHVSLIETLTLLLNNPKIKKLIEDERPSTDGVMRSYLDGRRAKSHSLVCRYPNIIRLQLYWDDVEVANPLGSKTSIHKLAAFYYQIQNLPHVESAQLSSILLLMLAHSEDLKIPNAFDKVLAPFLHELRKLESNRGVTITVNNQPYVLRATLVVLVADTLAAHDILGYLGPGARHFCRKCMLSRQVFHQDCNAMGTRRTKAMFEDHARQVCGNPALSTEYGIQRGCPLHIAKDFSACQDAVFDIFHDLLEGVAQWDMFLALRCFIKVDHLLTPEELNERISAFNYGVMDIKNKPSANFTNDSFKAKNKKLKQNGCQAWCLARMFGFLFPEVPEDNPHLQLVNLLQESMLYFFSGKLRQSDIDKLRDIVTRHHSLYQQLYMDIGEEILEDDAPGPDESDVDDPAEEVVNARRRINPGNKMHHMKEAVEEAEEYGPPFLYWCARYEARHQLFTRYGAVCCNFINITKSMAQMYQMSTLCGIRNTSLRQEELEVLGASDIPLVNCDHRELLLESGYDDEDTVEIATAVKIAGDEYRVGVFVLISAADSPTFAIIKRVYVVENEVTFIVHPWNTIGFVKRFCAYQVEPAPDRHPLAKHYHQLATHGGFAPWNPWKQRTTFIAPRTIIF